MNFNNSKVLILWYKKVQIDGLNNFLEHKDYTIIQNSDPKYRYVGFPQNDHHFTTELHRRTILPALSTLLDFEFDKDQFNLVKNRVQKDNKTFNLDYYKPRDLGYRFKVKGLEYGVEYESDFSGLLFSEKYKEELKQTGLLSEYHRLYAFPHSCSIVQNLHKHNGRTLLISGDSQIVPSIPVLCTIFKEVWYFNNRTDKSFKGLLESQKFDDILFQIHEGKLPYYTERNLK